MPETISGIVEAMRSTNGVERKKFDFSSISVSVSWRILAKEILIENKLKTSLVQGIRLLDKITFVRVNKRLYVACLPACSRSRHAILFVRIRPNSIRFDPDEVPLISTLFSVFIASIEFRWNLLDTCVIHTFVLFNEIMGNILFLTPLLLSSFTKGTF